MSLDSTLHHPHTGLWISGDGRIRQELRPDGRFDEIRRDPDGVRRGRYAIDGARIVYTDEAGGKAEGEFVGGVLYRRGTIFLHMADG